MKKIYLFLLVTALFFITSCATTSSTTKTTYSKSQYRTVQTSQTVSTAPIIADLVVSEKKINYAERINTVIFGMSQAEAKALAEKESETVIANALKANKADVLVAPITDIQTDANGYLVIEVTGYPAVYKNFRNASKEEMWIVERPAPTTTKEEKKSAMPVALPGKK